MDEILCSFIKFHSKRNIQIDFGLEIFKLTSSRGCSSSNFTKAEFFNCRPCSDKKLYQSQINPDEVKTKFIDKREIKGRKKC